MSTIPGRQLQYYARQPFSDQGIVIAYIPRHRGCALLRFRKAHYSLAQQCSTSAAGSVVPAWVDFTVQGGVSNPSAGLLCHSQDCWRGGAALSRREEWFQSPHLFTLATEFDLARTNTSSSPSLEASSHANSAVPLHGIRHQICLKSLLRKFLTSSSELRKRSLL